MSRTKWTQTPRKRQVPVPATLALPSLEKVRAESPSSYDAMVALANALQGLRMAVEAEQVPDGVNQPDGPRHVTVTPIDGAHRVSFAEDLSGQIDRYEIWALDGGTRGAPVTPKLAAAYLIMVIPATAVVSQDFQGYTYLDKSFTVTQKDPSNPARRGYVVRSVDEWDRASVPIPATTSGVLPSDGLASQQEILLSGPGDQSPQAKMTVVNKLWNSQFHNPLVTTANVNLGQAVNISGATNATPIQITTSTAHGLITGDGAYIWDLAVPQSANGYWIVTRIDNFNFTLNGSTAGGVYSNPFGATATPTVGQTASPLIDPLGPNAAFGVGRWSPWLGEGTLKFVSGGIAETQEILFPAASFGAPGSSLVLRQYLAEGALPYPGAHVSFSAWFRAPVAASGMRITISGNGAVPNTSLSTTLVGTTYVQLEWNFVVPAFTLGYMLQIIVTYDSGTAQDLYITRPLLVIGDSASAWTGQLDTANVGSQPVLTSSPAWARTVARKISRHSSAPYA